jgi:hypothetical protein
MQNGSTSAIERISRVLAGERISINAEGSDASAGPEVDGHWREYENQAVAVLKSLRDAPPEVARAGDGQSWSRMIEAALQGR